MYFSTCTAVVNLFFFNYSGTASKVKIPCYIVVLSVKVPCQAELPKGLLGWDDFLELLRTCVR